MLDAVFLLKAWLLFSLGLFLGVSILLATVSVFFAFLIVFEICFFFGFIFNCVLFASVDIFSALTTFFFFVDFEGAR